MLALGVIALCAFSGCYRAHTRDLDAGSVDSSVPDSGLPDAACLLPPALEEAEPSQLSVTHEVRVRRLIEDQVCDLIACDVAEVTEFETPGSPCLCAAAEAGNPAWFRVRRQGRYETCFEDYIVQARNRVVVVDSCGFSAPPIVREGAFEVTACSAAGTETVALGEPETVGVPLGCNRPLEVAQMLAPHSGVEHCGCFTIDLPGNPFEFVNECIATARASCAPAIFTGQDSSAEPHLLQHVLVIPTEAGCEIRYVEVQGDRRDVYRCEDVEIDESLRVTPIECVAI